MDTATRIDRYRTQRAQMSARQRRRMIKKAGRDPRAIIVRADGMGYRPAQQGEKLLIGFARTEDQEMPI